MPLLDRTGLKPDEFTRDDPAAPAIIVPLDGLDEALSNRAQGQRIGIDVPNTAVPYDLPTQAGIDLIAVAFPKFGDGRGFSIGHALREQGFSGTLRVSGALLPDQFAFALQCGFDEVEIDAERLARQPVEQWLAALGDVTLSYLESTDGTPSIFAKRAAAVRALAE
ncbi:DUF934 domain-containing protein [Sphingomonas sp.]|uniref:DUF934 domain-containing protein n=1 Tax=Sphingomonas sp. TaxID=28214 RepID=UPI00325FBA47